MLKAAYTSLNFYSLQKKKKMSNSRHLKFNDSS